jgi:hypothetical protein|nr:MAG TPA: hypothetical protein [Caudoviricetes sp.]
MADEVEKKPIAYIQATQDNKKVYEEPTAQIKLSTSFAVKGDTTKKTYHDQRLSQSKWAFRLSFFGGIVGFLVIIFGVWESGASKQIEIASILAGIITEAVSALFYGLSNSANEKISEFFQKLTEDENVQRSIELAEKIQDDKIRDELIVKLSLHLSGIPDDKICKNVRETCDKKE